MFNLSLFIKKYLNTEIPFYKIFVKIQVSVSQNTQIFYTCLLMM